MPKINACPLKHTVSMSVTSVRQYRHNFTNMRQVLPVQGRIQDFKLEGRAHLKKKDLGHKEKTNNCTVEKIYLWEN
jgi:hypothetical protein